MLKRFFTARRVGTTMFAAFMLAGCSAADAPPAPLSPVSDFDIERYAGEWHQIAAIPAWFQEQCVADTKAHYTLRGDGHVDVVNSCERTDGTMDEAEGLARFIEGPNEAKLEVTFVEVLGNWFWQAAGDYWVIGLDQGYRWSVVGGPDRKYAWVLARVPRLDGDSLNAVHAILERAGYDGCDLAMTAPGRDGRLCDHAE